MLIRSYMNLKVINVNETSRRTPTKLHQPTSTFHLNTRLRKGQVPPGFDNKVWNWNVPLSPQTRHIDFRLTMPALPQEDQHSGVLHEVESRIIPNINRRENSVCVCVCCRSCHIWVSSRQLTHIYRLVYFLQAEWFCTGEISTKKW